jgi:hypothetical protein
MSSEKKGTTIGEYETVEKTNLWLLGGCILWVRIREGAVGPVSFYRRGGSPLDIAGSTMSGVHNTVHKTAHIWNQACARA